MPVIKCPQCGQEVTYAQEGKAVKCEGCGSSLIPTGAADRLVGLKCEACGGALNVTAGTTQAQCPFCNAVYLLPPAYAAGVAPPTTLPRFLTPCAVFQNNMLDHLNRWLNQGVFTAADADTAAAVTAVEAKYAPLYVVTADASSYWSGQNGTTQYRTVTRTRQTAQGRAESYTEQEPYKEWHPASGQHTGHYRVAVSAYPSLPQPDLDKLAGDAGNFRADEGSQPYTGVPPGDNITVVEPAFDDAEGRRRGQIKIEELERAACSALVERLESCSTQLTNVATRLTYHPFWWITYAYKGKRFNCVMDGRTGACAGKKPVSKKKVVFVIILGLLIVTALILALVCFGGNYCLSSS